VFSHWVRERGIWHRVCGVCVLFPFLLQEKQSTAKWLLPLANVCRLNQLRSTKVMPPLIVPSFLPLLSSLPCVFFFLNWSVALLCVACFRCLPSSCCLINLCKSCAFLFWCFALAPVVCKRFAFLCFVCTILRTNARNKREKDVSVWAFSVQGPQHFLFF
jgi:hypothetical protein